MHITVLRDNSSPRSLGDGTRLIEMREVIANAFDAMIEVGKADPFGTRKEIIGCMEPPVG